MKNKILKFTIILGLIVVSCDKADLSQEKNVQNDISIL